MAGLTAAFVGSKFAAMRSMVGDAAITIRHIDSEYSGTRIPAETVEVVDDLGAIRQVVGAVRLAVSDLGPVWPKVDDQIEVYDSESGEWLTRVITEIRLDEMQATMLVTYGERYD